MFHLVNFDSNTFLTSLTILELLFTECIPSPYLIVSSPVLRVTVVHSKYTNNSRDSSYYPSPQPFLLLLRFDFYDFLTHVRHSLTSFLPTCLLEYRRKSFCPFTIPLYTLFLHSFCGGMELRIIMFFTSSFFFRGEVSLVSFKLDGSKDSEFEVQGSSIRSVS